LHPAHKSLFLPKKKKKMTSVLAAAAGWGIPPISGAQSNSNCGPMANRRLRAHTAALFLAAGRTTHTAASLCQALFTEGANAWLATPRKNDPLAVRVLQSWPRGVLPHALNSVRCAGDAGVLCTLHLPVAAAADQILYTAATHHPGTVREVILQQPPGSVGIVAVKAATVDRCVAAWAPNLVVWSVFASSASLARATVDALYGGGCLNLEVLAMPLVSAAKARQRRERQGPPSQEAFAGDLLHDAIDKIVPLTRLVRLTVYTADPSNAELPSRSLARFAPQLRDLEFGRGQISFSSAEDDGPIPPLRALRGHVKWLDEHLRQAVAAAAIGVGTVQPKPLPLPDVMDVPRVSADAVRIASLAACAPNLANLVLEFSTFMHVASPAHISALSSLQNLRRLELITFRGIESFGDALVSGLLSSLPRLAILHIGASHHFGSAVTFAPAAYGSVTGDNAFPAMRELNVARQNGIRKEGLDHIVHLFPNLRALDMRGCFGLSLNDFATAMLEKRPDARAAASADGGADVHFAIVPMCSCADCVDCADVHFHHRLRLRKLRSVVASYRRRVPKALNFIEYHCGNYGTVEARIAAGHSL
jgi:hypothetical protein